jgi:adenylosuccinate lyase
LQVQLKEFAIEIRHLQRTEVYELQEFFSKNQKGSSAMPHKKNPILSENLTGLARMVRSAVVPALENIALWHERDISHSSVERNIGPDANITIDFALVRLTNILDNIIVYPKKMLENLNLTKGLIFSQELMLELTKSGLSREKSYKMVQTYAKKCFAENLNLFDVVSDDKFIMSKITTKRLKEIFSYNKHFKNVNLIFRRVFK